MDKAKKEELIAAYMRTNYIVDSIDLVINIGKHSEKLFKLLNDYNCHEFCFITAWNPYSDQSYSREENELRNEKLKKDLFSYYVLEGYGEDADKKWPAEQSFLVLGISKENSILLAKKYEQNAIVYGSISNDEIVSLLVITNDEMK